MNTVATLFKYVDNTVQYKLVYALSTYSTSHKLLQQGETVTEIGGKYWLQQKPVWSDTLTVYFFKKIPFNMNYFNLFIVCGPT